MDATPDKARSFWKAFGPGVLFAGASVGVSHLVQSTRAGANFGLSLAVVVILACVFKYTAFRFGPFFASATGTSLLEGYRRQGVWALSVYALFTLVSMFVVQAAVTFVTAGLAGAVLGVSWSATLTSAGLLAVCMALLLHGRYRWLDRISKLVVAVLTVSTFIATALALPRVDWSGPLLPGTEVFTLEFAFLAGLVGWMPTAVDLAVWQSLWTLARQHESGYRASVRESMLDFHIGYLGTGFLGICFLVLGAGVMHPTGRTFEDTAVGFARQVLDLYGETLGWWAEPVVAVAAFAVMFSTTLTCLDGFPRAVSVLLARYREAESPGGAEEDSRRNRRAYWISMVVISAGSVLIIESFLQRLKAMVMLATILSFVIAPVLAWLNHRAAASSLVPPHLRPGRGLLAFSWVSIGVLGFCAGWYLWRTLL